MKFFFIYNQKPYVVTPHLNHLTEMVQMRVTTYETVQMRGHNIGFYGELTKNIINYHQILPLI